MFLYLRWMLITLILSSCSIMAMSQVKEVAHPSNQSSPKVRTILTGRVFDAESHVALVGASIYMADMKVGVVSKDGGFFHFNSLPTGKHLLELSFVGYATLTEYVESGDRDTLDFLLHPAAVEKGEVVITGVSHATQVRRMPVTIDVVKKEQLLKSVSSNIIDAISKQPGIAQITTGPAISKPVIRGLGYNRVVVVNDGIRQEGQQWGDEHGIEIDEFSVSRVEILKGPSSLVYGSDAMAGVINIITNSPLPEGTIRGNVIGQYQSNNAFRGFGANLGGNLHGFNWNAYGSFKAAADYRNRYDGRVFNSKFNEKNGGGYFGYNGNWGYSHLIFSYFHQDLGIVEGKRDEDGNLIKELPGDVEGIPMESDFRSTIPQVPYEGIRHLKVASVTSVNLGGGNLQFIFGHQVNKRMEYGEPDNPKIQDLAFNLGTTTWQATWNLRERKGWQHTFGASGMFQQNRNMGQEVLIPEYMLRDAGAYFHTQRTVGKLTYSGGLRLDNRHLHSRYLEKDGEVRFNAFTRDFTNLSGSAGISYRPTKNLTLKTNLARGFRAPSIPELASNGAHEGSKRYEYGNKDLQSETSLQWDGSLEWSSEHFSLEATVFHNRIDNFIFYRKLVSVAGGDSLVESDGRILPAYQYDQRKASLSGAELSVDIHPHPLDWLHIENTFSFVRGIFAKALDGSRNIPYIPAARIISELRADLLDKGRSIRNLSMKLEMDATSQQSNAFTGFGTETPTAGYTLFNAGLSADIVSKNTTLMSIYLMALNLGDVAYQSHLSRLKYTDVNLATGRTGVFAMGRNFSVKVNIPLSWTAK